MTESEIIELFLQAEEEEFITDLLDYADCTSECTECPASQACKYMSALDGKKSYDNFKREFDIILPKLKEIKDKTDEQ